jgi:hypothetical protein
VSPECRSTMPVIRFLDLLPSTTNAAVPNPSFRLPLLTAKAVPAAMACAIYLPLSVTDTCCRAHRAVSGTVVRWFLKVVAGTLLDVLVPICSVLVTVIYRDWGGFFTVTRTSSSGISSASIGCSVDLQTYPVGISVEALSIFSMFHHYFVHTGFPILDVSTTSDLCFFLVAMGLMDSLAVDFVCSCLEMLFAEPVARHPNLSLLDGMFL